MTQKRILIIDDIQSVRSALRGYLCPPISAQEMVKQLIQKGTLNMEPKLHIDEATQGAEGVEMCRAALESGTPYDIAFVDMLMPLASVASKPFGRFENSIKKYTLLFAPLFLALRWKKSQSITVVLRLR